MGEFNRPLKFLLDTGASVNLIKRSEVSPYINIDKNSIIILKGITPESLNTLGKVIINFFDTNAEFHLVEDNFPIEEAGILGNDFFRKNNARINYSENYLEIKGQILPFEHKVSSTYDEGNEEVEKNKEKFYDELMLTRPSKDKTGREKRIVTEAIIHRENKVNKDENTEIKESITGNCEGNVFRNFDEIKKELNNKEEIKVIQVFENSNENNNNTKIVEKEKNPDDEARDKEEKCDEIFLSQEASVEDR